MINIISNIALSDESGFKVFYRNKISHTNSLNKVNLNSKDSIRAKNEKSIQKACGNEHRTNGAKNSEHDAKMELKWEPKMA